MKKSKIKNSTTTNITNQKKLGLRQRVKAGIISPEKALEELKRVDSNPSPSILKWLQRKVAKA